MQHTGAAVLLCLSLIIEAAYAYTMPWIEQGLHAEEGRKFPACFLPFVPWAKRSQVDVLKQLLSLPDDMNEHVDITCEALTCMQQEHAEQIVAFATRESTGVWALIRWAQQHVATGTDLARYWATQFIRGGGEIGPLHQLVTQGIHPQVSLVLVRMLQEPKLASESVLHWINQVAAKKNHGAIAKDLDRRIQEKAIAFKHAAEGSRSTDSIPFTLMEVVEAYSARVLDTVLDELEDTALEALREEDSIGYTVLQKAAAQGSTGHIIVLLYHAKSWGADQKLLQDTVPRRRGFFHQGLTAAEIAHARGNCEAAAVLGSTLTCPSQHKADMQSGEVWGVRGWTKTATANGHLEEECQIPTIKYSSSKDWPRIIHEHSVNRQPFRITGLGRALFTQNDKVLDPFTPEALAAAPCGQMTRRVGDIPYRGSLTGNESGTQSISLGQYVKNLQTSSWDDLPQKASSYWFVEFHEEGPFTNCEELKHNAEVLHMAIDIMKNRVFSALGFDPREPVERTQHALGSNASASPLHTHGRAINLVLHGTKRWLMYPTREGVWSNQKVSKWWEHQAKLAPKNLQCMQNPGDVIFVPDEYPHSVHNIETTQAISWILWPYLEQHQVRAPRDPSMPRCNNPGEFMNAPNHLEY